MTGDDSASSAGASAPPKRFAIVGIGASAGGVRALQSFFESLPDDVEAAFVVVVHLDPIHQSELAAILATRTRMPVTQVAGRIRIEPRHVYVIPPNRQLLVSDQHLAITEFDEPRWQRAPIDLFFRSLAAQRNNDFAIILSGAGSDGSVGIKAVKEAGGIILVQDPEEAEYPSMPRNAVATGLADLVLPVREIAAQLPELVNTRSRLQPAPMSDAEADAMQRILSHLRVRTGHDFSNYKKSTIRRRIARRMQVQRVSSMADYLPILREKAQEAHALFADLLVSVTTFFRDADAFERLETLVIPKLFDDKGAGDSVRVWIPGCATGEEAYSIAILLLEEAGRRDIRCQVQVFATDLDDAALAIARDGRYPFAVEADISEGRLQRFFTREVDHYRVTHELRDVILFTKHSLLKDPPFSRIDLISCRNVLIYLDRELQQQIVATFHFALGRRGYLFLGSSENADAPVGMFRSIDRESRLYERMSLSGDTRPMPRIGPLSVGAEPLPARAPAPIRAPSEAVVHLAALERLAPSAVVDEASRVIHLSETAGRYLQPSAGALVNDITELAREELRFDLRTALHRVFARNEPSLSGPIAVRFNGAARRVYMQTKPLVAEPSAARTAIVFFFEGETLGEVATGPADIEQHFQGDQVLQLQQELHFAQSQLRTSREEYEGANEELRAANEELQSINEEYRSTAEELETSKEELQSINEELQTVNIELKTKLESVSRAHSDIQNLMVATDVGILFLDTQLRINRFTPRIADVFNIKAGDEGRSITNFTHSLEYDGLAQDASTVLRDLTLIEREVRTRTGAWCLMRLRPYRTVEDKIDGVVATFVDISERKRDEDALRYNEARMRAVINSVADALITMDDHGTIQAVNAATLAAFGYGEQELVGRQVSEIVPELDHHQGGGVIERYLSNDEGKIVGVGREVQGRRKDGLDFPAELTVSEIRHGDERLFIAFVRDLSELRRVEARLNRLHSNRIDLMTGMATSLAHELNQPLGAAANYLSAARNILNAQERPSPAADEALDKAAAQILRAGQIISHLREFMARGEPDKVEQSLHALIRRTYELVAPLAKEHNVEIDLMLNAAEDLVLADRVQIEQAMVNIVRNAIEAMNQSSERKLVISTALEDGMIRAEFADTGAGLSSSANAGLFVPFTSSKSTGLGVGLSISRSIIEAHYGTIWAEANPGGGSRFCFTLPLARFERVEK